MIVYYFQVVNSWSIEILTFLHPSNQSTREKFSEMTKHLNL